MTEKRCILTSVEITPNNDSAAHVIPSALGGRLAPSGLVTHQANTELNDKFDYRLIKAFMPLMTLLGASPHRGETQPIEMIDATGKRYIVNFGEPLQLGRPEFNEKVIDADTKEYRIRARTMKELRTMLGKVKKENPSFDIDAAMQRAVTGNGFPTGMLAVQLSIGGDVVLPAVFNMAAIFAASKNVAPHRDWKTYVEKFDEDQPALPPDTYFWLPPKPLLRVPADVSHVIALFCDAGSQKACFYASLFGLPPVIVSMPYSGSLSLVHTYAVDVIDGKELNLTLSGDEMQEIIAAAPEPDFQRIQDSMVDRIRHLVGLAQKRASQEQIQSILDQVMAQIAEKTFISAKEAGDLAQKAAELLMKSQPRGQVPPTLREPLPETPQARAEGCLCAVVRFPTGDPYRDGEGRPIYRVDPDCPVHVH